MATAVGYKACSATGRKAGGRGKESAYFRRCSKPMCAEFRIRK